MQDLKFLSDSELEAQLQWAVSEEKKAVTKVLHLLLEVERRKLYSKTSPSLFEFCTKVLGYSNGSAQRRIDAMRALKIEPKLEAKILSGALNLSSVSKTQFFLREQAKAGKPYSVEAKRALFQAVENKSSREVEKLFVSLSPRSVSPDKRTEVSAVHTELKVTLDSAAIEMLEKIKSLWSQKYGHLTDSELILRMAEFTLEKLNPEGWNTRRTEKAQKSENMLKLGTANTTAAGATFTTTAVVNKNALLKEKHSLKKPEPRPLTKSNPRYISRAIKQQVFIRDQGKCTHPGCNSSHFLDYDHIKPVVLGGSTTVENLRLLCHTHHRFHTQRLLSLLHGRLLPSQRSHKTQPAGCTHADQA